MSDLPNSLPIVDSRISEVRCDWAQPPADIVAEISKYSIFAFTNLFASVRVQAVVKVDVNAICAANKGKEIEDSFIIHCAGSQLSDALENLFAISDLADQAAYRL